MAATRLVEELVARGYPGHVTVLGDEPAPAYNRILLSAVLEGTHDRGAITLRRPGWYAEHGVTLRLGTRVLTVDREHRDVMLVDGETIGWDRLVLATGVIPTLPPMRGLVRVDGTLHPAVHAFRSLADCERLDAAVSAATGAASSHGSGPEAGPGGGPRRAVVVGGGLLGLQVARALALRGLRTELIEGSEHVLSRQVVPAAGQLLARSLRRLGTEVYVGARGVRLLDRPDPEGRPGVGVQLDNGHVLDTDLVVLTAGGRPSVALARNAGLAVRRGVVVDDQLASVTDAAVHAIGDCAEHRETLSGFVPPAWEQASVLARRLCGEDVAYEGTRAVARLRATDLDVAVLGDPVHAEGEVVEVANPLPGPDRAGKHSRLVVRDGVIEAASLVGDLSKVGLITQLYDRRTPLGLFDPGELLLPDPADEPLRPVLGEDAEVCACARVTVGRVRACADLDEARATTRATTGCGGCRDDVRALCGTSTRTQDPRPLSPTHS
ncbi:NAD(P)/FAD-dependent oxidoreductase [Nocardioides sp. HDW12B]|nr:NAD(P)/FAD-dependent oxidoreductase [Nocardioides sp. HDW12B]